MTAVVSPAVGLNQRLARLAEHDPDGPALRYLEAGLWRTVSRARLASEVGAVGAGLVALGIAPRDCVLIASSARYEWLLVELAVQAGAGIAVSAPLFDPPERLVDVIGAHDVKVVLAEDQEQVDRVLAAGAVLSGVTTIVYLDGRGLGRYQDPRLMSFEAMRATSDSAETEEWQRRRGAVGPEDVTSVVPTLGTSGPTRAVRVTHQMLERDLAALQSLVEPRTGDTFVTTLPHQHPLERRLTVLGPLLEPGVTVHFGDRSAPPEQTLREVQPTVVVGTPRRWRRWQVRTSLALDRSTRLTRAGCRIAPRLAHRRILRSMGLGRARLALTSPGGLVDSATAWFASLGTTVVDVYTTADAGVIAWAGTVADGVEREARDGELWFRHDAWRRHPGDDDGWYPTGDIGDVAPGTTQVEVIGRRPTPGAAVVAGLERRLADHPTVAHALVELAEDRTTAWLALDEDAASAWAERRGIGFVTMHDLTCRDEIGELAEAVVRGTCPPGPGTGVAVTHVGVVPFAVDITNGTRTVGDEPRRYAVMAALAEVETRLHEVP